jgi:hypothetical protein
MVDEWLDREYNAQGHGRSGVMHIARAAARRALTVAAAMIVPVVTGTAVP